MSMLTRSQRAAPPTVLLLPPPLLLLLLHALVLAPRPATARMEFMSFYGVDVAAQAGWLNLGVARDAADVDAYYREANISCLMEMPSAGIYQISPTRSLLPTWNETLTAFVTDLVLPRLRNNTLRGVFLGDEICCHNAPCWKEVLTPLSSALRRLLGPKALLYENECGDSISTLPPGEFLSPDLDLVSIDVYQDYLPSSPISPKEALSARHFAETEMYPRMHPHQRIMFVPGTFACSNLSFMPLNESSARVVAALDGFFQWGLEDDRVAGFNPWHFNDRGHPQHNPPCDMQLGAVSMPKVVEKLKEIGKHIIHG